MAYVVKSASLSWAGVRAYDFHLLIMWTKIPLLKPLQKVTVHPLRQSVRLFYFHCSRIHFYTGSLRSGASGQPLSADSGNFWMLKTLTKSLYPLLIPPALCLKGKLCFQTVSPVHFRAVCKALTLTENTGCLSSQLQSVLGLKWP